MRKYIYKNWLRNKKRRLKNRVPNNHDDKSIILLIDINSEGMLK